MAATETKKTEPKTAEAAPRSLADTLARVRADSDQRKSAADFEYRSLVRRCANGAEIEPALIVRQLDAWDKTAEQFQKDVTNLSERLSLKAVIAKLPEHRSAVDAIAGKVRSAVEECTRAIEAATTKRDSLLTPLIAEEQSALAAIRQCEAAEQRLSSLMPAPSPEQQARIREAKQKLAIVTDRHAATVGKADGILRSLPDRIRQAQERVAFFASPPVGMYFDPTRASGEGTRRLDHEKALRELEYLTGPCASEQHEVIRAADAELRTARAELAAIIAEIESEAW